MGPSVASENRFDEWQIINLVCHAEINIQ